MKKIIKALRLLLFILIMLAAAFGAGISGHFLPTTRERYRDHEIRIEQTDKKDEEENDDSKKEKQ